MLETHSFQNPEQKQNKTSAPAVLQARWGNTTVNSRLMCISTTSSSLLKPGPEMSQGFTGTMVLIWKVANATTGGAISREEINLDHIQMFWQINRNGLM